jgi:SAM-dependent methyltransferase
MDLESPACPLCNGTSLTRSFERAFAPYALARCARCRFHFLSPRPVEAQMREHYRSAEYYATSGRTGYDDYERSAHALRKTFDALMRQLERDGLTGGELLEVGCGHGYFLERARAHFARVEATEIAELAARAADVHAACVYRGGIEAVPVDRRYDLIVALQVLEHVYEPLAFLRELRSKVRAGGHVFIGVPDMGSPWRHVLRARWPSFKVPEHVLYFDRSSLLRVLEKAGFSHIRAVPHPYAYALPALAAQLGVRLPARLDSVALWVPRTAIAAVGRA